MTEVRLPELAAGVAKATVSYWHRQKGDAVSQGDDLVEMVTDKATFNVPSPATGRVLEIAAPEGAEVAVGGLLAKID